MYKFLYSVPDWRLVYVAANFPWTSWFLRRCHHRRRNHRPSYRALHCSPLCRNHPYRPAHSPVRRCNFSWHILGKYMLSVFLKSPHGMAFFAPVRSLLRNIPGWLDPGTCRDCRCLSYIYPPDKIPPGTSQSNRLDCPWQDPGIINLLFSWLDVISAKAVPASNFLCTRLSYLFL